jgi:hypothetical protein
MTNDLIYDVGMHKGEDTGFYLGYRDFMAVEQGWVARTAVPRPAREGRDVPHEFPCGSSGLFGLELAGAWRSKAGILREYEAIFREYERFGDGTAWERRWLGTRLKGLVSRVMGRPLPGWYDTHARHRSVVPDGGAGPSDGCR